MRTLQKAYEAVENYSPAEKRFNRRRRTAGLIAAPLAMALVLLLPFTGLAPGAHHMAGIMALVFVLWVTEALPMAVTALVGPVLAVVLEVASARETFAPFADPIIFLFIGSFMLAEAMFVHGVDRRVAYMALSWRAIGTSGSRILGVYGAATIAVSMWISNTATAAMMFPIGLSIVSHLARARQQPPAAVRRFALAIMLITSFAASVGGMATPVGTPPNLIGIGFLESIEGVHIGFFRWMAIGVPMVLLLYAFLMLYFQVMGSRTIVVGVESRALVADELKKLGPLSTGERNVLLAFGITVLLWIAPGVLAIAGLSESLFARLYQRSIPEGIAALLGALLLFMLPVNWRTRRFTLSWDEAVRIDWGIVLLYGGGLAIGELAFRTGLATAVGEVVIAWLPSHTLLAVTSLVTALAIVLSEATSNTASANMIVPVAIAIAKAAGLNPVIPALGATFGASLGFMLPISAAPNAIVYSSGYVPIGQMMKYGLALDVAGFVVIVTVLNLWATMLF